MKSAHAPRSVGQRLSVAFGLVVAVGMVACNPNSGGVNVSDGSNINNSSTDTTGNAVSSAKWSDPVTWGGTVPAAGSNVTIPANKAILLDKSISLKNLTILGRLEFADQNLELSAASIMLHGTLRIGEVTKPFSKKATITLTETNTATDNMGMGSRGILIMGGTLELFGQKPSVAWTRIADGQDVQANATTFNLEKLAGWKAGDQVILTPTEFYPTFAWNDDAHALATERLEITAATGSSLSLKTGVKAFRWGKKQYVTASGLSITPNTGITPRVLDERAEVGNLTRNIVVQGADDALWKTQGFGAHVMNMSGGQLRADGVEFRRMGQLGVKGRYPLHWHMQSSDGRKILPDVTNQYLRNSSIWDSKNRCITIHGTSGLQIQNNICFNILGHAIFLEDGVERRNTITSNLITGVRNPPKAKQFLKHDGEGDLGGAGGMWLTNPDNTVTGNVAADAQGNGYWLSFPNKPLGLNKAVPMLPANLAFGKFDDNVAHSNQMAGINFDLVVLNANDTGETAPHKYVPTKDGLEDRYDLNRVRFGLNRVTLYKNRAAGLWNRVSWPDYKDFVSADNGGTYFAGAGDDGKISGALVVGYSLNNRPLVVPAGMVSNAPSVTDPRVGFASYHSTFDMFENTLVNMPFVDGKLSGAFKTNDYYITAVDKGTVSNPNNRLIAAHPGYREQPNLAEHWTLAGALWDPFGYWGPKGNYWVYDNPFLTVGATCVDVLPAGKNGKSCNGQYYGVGDYVTDFDGFGTDQYMFRSPLEVIRQDANGLEIGRWTVGDGRVGCPKLCNMRHFAARSGGRYVMRFKDASQNRIPKKLEVGISNAFRATDSFVLGVNYNGTQAIKQVYQTSSPNRIDPLTWTGTESYANRKRLMTATSSLANVIASSGDKYFRDAAQNLVWVKIQGGLPNPDHDYEVQNSPKSDFALYGNHGLVIAPQ
jgi:hypothetical protein